MIAHKKKPFPVSHSDAILDKIYPEFDFSHTCRAKTWDFKAENTWIWMDYISIKQSIPSGGLTCQSKNTKTSPKMCLDYKTKSKSTSGVTREEIQEIAASSLATYIECTDIMLIFTPELPKSLHCKPTLGREHLCYRTFLGRGWCVMELFTSILCRRTQSLLLMRRSDGVPESTSPHILTSTTSVGKCQFTCCSVNHVFSDNTKVSCDREIAYKILSKMIDRKVEYLWHHNMPHKARIFMIVRELILDGLQDTKAYKDYERFREIKRFRDPAKQFEYELRWNHEIDDPIGMETGMTLLKFAILAKNESAVKALVERRTKKGLPIDDPISVSTWCSSAKRENFNIIPVTLTCTSLSKVLEHSISCNLLIRNKTTSIRILNSRFALEHRYDCNVWNGQCPQDNESSHCNGFGKC